MKESCLLGSICLIALLLFPPANASVLYDEAIDGDIGDPADFGTLTDGSYKVIGTLDGGDDDTTTGVDESDRFFFSTSAEWSFEFTNFSGQDITAFIFDQTDPFRLILFAVFTSGDDTTASINAGDFWIGLSPVLRSFQSTYEVTLNVGSVPIPASVWLFGSGLLGLIGVARKKTV